MDEKKSGQNNVHITLGRGQLHLLLAGRSLTVTGIIPPKDIREKIKQRDVKINSTLPENLRM